MSKAPSHLKIVFKKPLGSRVVGGVFLGFAIVAACMVFSLDFRPSFQQENVVEFLYENAMPVVGLLLWMAFAGVGIAFLASDVLEAERHGKHVTHRLVPPLQPARRYKFSDFHTVRAETRSTSKGGTYHVLEMEGGTKTLTLSEPSIHKAKEHAQSLAQFCGLGYGRVPHWEVPEALLKSATSSTVRNRPPGNTLRHDTEGGFEVIFTKSTSLRWSILLPCAGLMAASWWAMTPWYIYLLWIGLAAGTIAWIGWQGSDHTLSIRETRLTYLDHSNTEIYQVDLSTQSFLDIKGDDIVCARPGNYQVLTLPRATLEQKVWIKNELLRVVAEN